MINLCISLELLHNDLSVILLLHYSVTILRFLVLLVPAPLIDLRLSKPCCLGDSATCLLGPVGILSILLHQVLHLVWVLSISLFSVFNTLLHQWLVEAVVGLYLLLRVVLLVV